MPSWVEAFNKRRIARLNKLSLEVSIQCPKLNPAPCTQKDLKLLLSYDPNTGVFIWTGHKYKAHNGKVAGCKHKYKDRIYWEIKIFGKKYKAHVLAHYYITGIWSRVDHKNNKTLDNSFDNLRASTDLENGRNKLITKNSLGYKGVSRVRGMPNKFQSFICVNYKRLYLGCFNTPEDAYAAYCEAAKKYHGEFANIQV